MKRSAVGMILLAFTGCAGLQEDQFEGTGAHTRTITTSSSEAQRWFNQGLNFLYAFNHDEAIRSFEKAAQADPHCAMAPWGVALANGPHINNPTSTRTMRRRVEGARKSPRAGVDGVAGREGIDRRARQALRRSAAGRSQCAGQGLCRRDARRVEGVSEDADIGAIFAESMMDLRPWDLWTIDGKPQPGTLELIHALEDVIDLNPKHPLALHLYIHAVEASPDPGRADNAADTLRTLTPGLGHLVHMPSHIDVRTGHWEQAVAANKRALATDAAYLQRRSPRASTASIWRTTTTCWRLRR